MRRHGQRSLATRIPRRASHRHVQAPRRWQAKAGRVADEVEAAGAELAIRTAAGRIGNSQILSHPETRGNCSTRDIPRSQASMSRGAEMRLHSPEVGQARRARRTRSYGRLGARTEVEEGSASPGEGANKVDCLSTSYDDDNDDAAETPTTRRQSCRPAAPPALCR